MSQPLGIRVSAWTHLLLLLAMTFVPHDQALAENGVTDTKIVIGTSTNLTGPSPIRSTEIKRGFEMYFKKINDSGGVNGRKIEVITYDDAYNPEKTLENTKKLVETDKVFALFSVFGAAASKAVLPYITASDVPFIFPGTGATALREPPIKNIFHLRLGYASEAASLIDYLVEKKGIKEIGIFYQDDPLGQEAKNGAQRALAKHGLSFKGEAQYNRAKQDINQAFNALKGQPIKAVLLAAVTIPAAQFAKKMSEEKISWLLAGLTPVGGPEFYKEAGAASEGALVAASFPGIDSGLEISKQFLADKKAFGSENLNFEGYLNAVVFVEALKRSGKDLTRAGLTKTLNAMNDFDAGGIKISLSPTHHEGLDRLHIFEIKGGKLSEVK